MLSTIILINSCRNDKFMKLEPRIVFSSGIMATGKTTVMKELGKLVDNALYLDRDDINQGNLHVAITKNDELLPFEKYVENAGIFPDHARVTQTPFGDMIKVDPHNAFYRRHMRDQSYLIQMYLVKTNLECGKVPIIDCITMRQIQDGTLKKMQDHEFFTGYPKYLIHFMVDEEEGYKRAVARSQADESARKRVDLIKSAGRSDSPTASRETFHKFITEEQPMVPKELSNYKHLVINTSHSTPPECARRCLEYISS